MFNYPVGACHEAVKLGTSEEQTILSRRQSTKSGQNRTPEEQDFLPLNKVRKRSSSDITRAGYSGPWTRSKTGRVRTPQEQDTTRAGHSGPWAKLETGRIWKQQGQDIVTPKEIQNSGRLRTPPKQDTLTYEQNQKAVKSRHHKKSRIFSTWTESDGSRIRTPKEQDKPTSESG